MDEDYTVNFAELNQPGDRAAVIVTTPLTSNETWTAFAPGELRVFVDGLPVV
jgi:glutamine amidotransferase